MGMSTDDYSPRLIDEPHEVYERLIYKAYAELTASGVVANLDLPVEDHPDYYLVLNHADELLISEKSKSWEPPF